MPSMPICRFERLITINAIPPPPFCKGVECTAWKPEDINACCSLTGATASHDYIADVEDIYASTIDPDRFMAIGKGLGKPPVED